MKKYWWLIVLVIAALAFGYWYYNKQKATDTPEKNDVPTDATDTARKQQIVELQNKLNEFRKKLGLPYIAVDGSIGKETKNTFDILYQYGTSYIQYK